MLFISGQLGVDKATGTLEQDESGSGPLFWP